MNIVIVTLKEECICKIENQKYFKNNYGHFNILGSV